MSDHGSFTIDDSQKKLGPIWLSPGVLPRHVLTLFYSAMFSIVFITFLNLVHPYVLHEHLGMPTEQQGNFTGNLYVVLELITIVFAIPLGVLSDRIGRRPIYTAGFLLLAIGMALIPTARTPEMMGLYRVIASLGIACCVTMTASLNADYPQNNSRGKQLAISGFFTALGIVIIASFLMAGLPEFYASRGMDPIAAGNATYWTGTALALLAAIVTWFGTIKTLPTKKTEREPLMHMLRVGIAEIRRNPRLTLGCGATFVSRGDLTVLATYFSLWIVAVGTDQGGDVGEISAKAGMLFGISQLAIPLSLPVVAMLVDRLDRVTMVAAAMGFTACGYFFLGVVPDPLGSWLIYPALILTGIGESMVIVTAPALVGQEAPSRVRGSIIGVTALCGGFGVLINVKASGYMFDAWSYQAPFLYMAGVNIALMLWALLVRLKHGSSRTTTAPG
ncbi:MAG: MFS transporter, partial [Gammaproteobacteria bacterium]